MKFKFDRETLELFGKIAKNTLETELDGKLDEDPETKVKVLECQSDLTMEYMSYMAADDPVEKEKHLQNMKHIKQTLMHIENTKNYKAWRVAINVTGIIIAQMIKAGIESVL